MEVLISYTPALLAMLVLLVSSGFCALSETAYFSLSLTERRALPEKGKFGIHALRLFDNPERLLNSLLLGNLFVNLVYFTLASIIAFHLSEKGYHNLAFGIGIGSFLIMVILCDILPKNVSVLAPQFFVLWTSVPITFLIRMLRPIFPPLSFLNVLSRRLFFPNFTQEPYLQVGDLERAVALSGDDAALLKREQRSLRHIVSLSDMEAAELMRPRAWLKLFRPPVSFEQIMSELNGTLPKNGYCLLTEPDSDEIVSALCLTRLTAASLETAWNEQFEEVVCVPWSASVAEVFDRLQQTNRRVAVVVNEFGETIGIITIDDIIASLFTREHGRNRELLDRRELRMLGDNRWQLTGLTSLRMLERKFGISFREYSSLTVGGLLSEKFERFPRIGDTCQVESLQFRVVNIEDGYDLIVHLTQSANEYRS